MEKLRDASFAARLGAFLVDLVAVSGVSAAGSILALGIVIPLVAPSNDPVEFFPRQAFAAEELARFGFPLAYVAASWSPLLGRRSLGKRLFHLRVVRDAE